MGTKRVGWARIKSLVNENQNALHPVLATDAGDAGTQGATKIIVGKNGAEGFTADPYQTSATKLFDLGTELVYGDRTYRYGKNGSSIITAGKLVAHKDLKHAEYRDMAVQADTAIGATAIPVTVGGTSEDATEDEFAEGYILINAGTGLGQLMKIKSHAAVDVSASTTMTLNLYDKLTTAVAASDSKADVIRDPWSDLVVAPTTMKGAVLGVTCRDMPANHYGWFQVAGPCSVLYDVNAAGATAALGDVLVRSDEVAGAAFGVAPADDGHQVIGTLMIINGNADHVLVWLNVLTT